MTDILRVVTLSAGGRPIVVQDLENGSTFLKVANTRTSFESLLGRLAAIVSK